MTRGGAARFTTTCAHFFGNAPSAIAAALQLQTQRFDSVFDVIHPRIVAPRCKPVETGNSELLRLSGSSRATKPARASEVPTRTAAHRGQRSDWIATLLSPRVSGTRLGLVPALLPLHETPNPLKS